jgi:hypothetical protein
MDKQLEFDLTSDHLKLLRELVVVWLEAEAGAPAVYSLEPYGSEDIYADMLRILDLKSDTSPSNEQKARLDTLQGEMEQAFEIFLQEASLPPSEYSYPNYHRKYADLMPPQFRTWERYGEWKLLPVPAGDMIVFSFRDEHLKLLRAANGGLVKDVGLGIDFKRPYGEMTTIELDMAAILGIPVPYDEQHNVNFSDEQQEHFHQLHTDMVFALPVFLRHGQLAPGHYHRDRSYGRPWVLANL